MVVLTTEKKKEFSIGSKDCDILINDPDMVEEKQGYILYDEKRGWYIERRGGDYSELTTGIYILLKNWKEFQSNSDVHPSKAHKLSKKMKIFFSYNVLQVVSV